MTQIRPRFSTALEATRNEIPAIAKGRGLREPPAERIISKAAVAYVLLWVLEGAARKWIPGLDQIFYIARDGLLIMTMVCVSIVYPRRLSSNIIFWPLVLALCVLAAVQVIVGEISTSVAVIGLRAYVAPAILVYAVWRYRPKMLVKRMAVAIMIVAPLEAVLSIIQVGMPAVAWLNKQVGDELTNFVNIGGIVRATGTFSAPSGLSAYVPLCLAISLAMFLRSSGKMRNLAGIAIISSLAMAGIGGSRGAIFSVAIVLAVFIAQQLALSDWGSVKLIATLASVLVVTLIGLQLTVPEVTASLLARFQTASASEDSGARLADQTFGFFWMHFDILGSGIGANSNAGVSYGSSGQWFEVDTQKWVSELGVLGYAAAVLRLVIVAFLLWAGLRRVRDVSALMLLVLSVWVPVVLFGQITQNPTLQGAFSIMAAIIFLAWHEETANSRHGDSLNVTQTSVVPARPHRLQEPGAFRDH